MKKYTVETLKAINEMYDYKHKVREEDVEKANKWVEFIEESRDNAHPQIGDIVQYTNEYGDYYSDAHIESFEDDKAYICENPYVPFALKVGEERVAFGTSTSGGAWTYLPRNLKYVGTREKVFKDWGHCGCCESGAIFFKAKVNVWEYIEGNPEFTTKDYSKFYVFIDQRDIADYKYLIKRDGLTSHRAFRTDEEYNAWIKTFRGVERPGYWSENQRIVWTYKQSDKCVPIEEYLAINEGVVIDSALCNGRVQECKRIYKGTTVETILPYQNNMIELKGTKEYMRAYID